MDILVVSQSCLSGLNREPYRHLAQLGWDVAIVCPARFESAGFSREADPVRDGDPPTYFLPITSSHPRRWRFVGLNELISDMCPRLVLVDSDVGSCLALEVGKAQRRHGGLLACISCDNMHRSIVSECQHGLSAVARYLATVGLTYLARRRVDHVFALSEDIIDVMASRGMGACVSKMPLGFDPELFYFDPEVRARRRTELDLQEVTVGYFGRMVPLKGVDLLIKALASITDLRWQLVLDEFNAYSDPYASEIATLLESEGVSSRTRFFDATHEEVPGYMNACDVIVLASRSTPIAKEQYGRVVTEAMACGRCVVVSDSGALPELVGEAGLVVPENDVGQLEVALRRVIGDPTLRATLGGRAKARAAKCFSTARQAEAMDEVFRALLT